MTERGKGGQFTSGNKAARGRKRRNRTTAELIDLVENKLEDLGEDRGIDELLALTVIRLLQLAAKGNLKAGIWVMERFYPAELEPQTLRTRLPSPTKKPSQYLEALGRGFSKGQLSSAQVARLANLAKADDLIEQLMAALEAAMAKQSILRAVN